MKKTNFNESVERFKERIKTDKKFKTQFATVMVASVVVIATAITVPTVIHNNKIKAKEDTSVPIVAETETETVTIPDGVETTVDEQGNVVAVTNENGEYVYTTAAPQTEPETETEAPKETSKQDASKPAANKPQNKKNNGSSNKNNGGNKGNAGNTGGSNNNEVQQDWRPVTEADVKSIVEEARAYAKSKGFVIDTSMTEVGTSWGPETGILYKFSPKWRAKYLEDLRYEVDSTYKLLREDYRWLPPELNDEGVWVSPGQRTEAEIDEMVAKNGIGKINIFYKYRPNDSEEPYYIYVVY